MGGERLNFEELYQQQAKKLYYYLYGMCHNSTVAEDIVQTTFLKAIEKINTYKANAKLSTWLFQIAKNEYLDYLRKNKNSRLEQADVVDKSDETTISILDQVIEQETTKTIQKYVMELAEPYRQVMLLRVYGECSYKEIGEMFDKTETWARVTYFRAKETVVKKWKKKEGEC